MAQPGLRFLSRLCSRWRQSLHLSFLTEKQHKTVSINSRNEQVGKTSSSAVVSFFRPCLFWLRGQKQKHTQQTHTWLMVPQILIIPLLLTHTFKFRPRPKQPPTSVCFCLCFSQSVSGGEHARACPQVCQPPLWHPAVITGGLPQNGQDLGRFAAEAALSGQDPELSGG